MKTPKTFMCVFSTHIFFAQSCFLLFSHSTLFRVAIIIRSRERNILECLASEDAHVQSEQVQER